MAKYAVANVAIRLPAVSEVPLGVRQCRPASHSSRSAKPKMPSLSGSLCSCSQRTVRHDDPIGYAFVERRHHASAYQPTGGFAHQHAAIRILQPSTDYDHIDSLLIPE
jgi:hypothetical protein